MMTPLNNLTYKLYHKQSAKRLFIVLHGSSTKGIESPFIINTLESLTHMGQNVLAFNFPYCERGQETSSGPELKEEVATLKQVIAWAEDKGYKITLIAKSLGGIVASYYLERYPNKAIDLIVLGYVVDDVKTSAIAPNLKAVIQGENDRFGNPKAVRTELGEIKASVIEIKGADHSYRNSQKEPKLQSLAISELLKVIKQ